MNLMFIIVFHWTAVNQVSTEPVDSNEDHDWLRKMEIEYGLREEDENHENHENHTEPRNKISESRLGCLSVKL